MIFYIYLLTEIYRNGYYIRWDEDSIDNAIVDLGLTEGLIEQIMTFLVSRSLLNRSILANSDTIITSPGIQKRYQEAVKSLKRDIYVDQEIWLLSKEETASCIKCTINDSKSEKNSSKSEKNYDKSKKNPTKEIKGKENKVNNITVSKDTVRQTQDVQLVVEEWNSLIEFGIKPISKLTCESKRYRSLVARIKQYGVDDVLKAIDNIRNSDFLQGKASKRPWVITFDWFVLPNNFPKVLEGQYNNDTDKEVNTYESESTAKLW